MEDRKIIAVDFDGTLVENDWPDIGEAKYKIIKKIIKEKEENNAYIIIWTCRSGKQLYEMQNWLDKSFHTTANLIIPYDRINANAPWIIDKYGRDNRKIYADEYWDDRAVRI